MCNLQTHIAKDEFVFLQIKSSLYVHRMSLEILPDELLLFICSYLKPLDVLQAFSDLNTRLNCAISHYRKCLNLTRISYGQFNKYCDMLLQTTLGSQVQSLKLSNHNPVVQQVSLFARRMCPLNQTLPSIEFLILNGITTYEIDLLLPNIIRFKKLTELTITGGRECSEKLIQEYFHTLTKKFMR